MNGATIARYQGKAALAFGVMFIGAMLYLIDCGLASRTNRSVSWLEIGLHEGGAFGPAISLGILALGLIGGIIFSIRGFRSPKESESLANLEVRHRTLLTKSLHGEITVPPTGSAKALSGVRAASMAAFVLAFIIAAAVCYQRAHIEKAPLLAPLLEPLLMCVLGFGIWHKSRVCASVLLLYWLGAKIFILVMMPFGSGFLTIALTGGFYFFRGAICSFDYHSFLRDELEKLEANQSSKPSPVIGSSD